MNNHDWGFFNCTTHENWWNSGNASCQWVCHGDVHGQWKWHSLGSPLSLWGHRAAGRWWRQRFHNPAHLVRFRLFWPQPAWVETCWNNWRTASQLDGVFEWSETPMMLGWTSLSGWWFQYLWKIWRSVGINYLFSNIWKNWKIKNVPTPHTAIHAKPQWECSPPSYLGYVHPGWVVSIKKVSPHMRSACVCALHHPPGLAVDRAQGMQGTFECWTNRLRTRCAATPSARRYQVWSISSKYSSHMQIKFHRGPLCSVGSPASRKSLFLVELL